MPTPTYTPLATVTLGTAASSVTFSSIPATYRDLILVSQVLQNTTGIRQGVIRPNNDSVNANLAYLDGSGLNAGTGTTTILTSFYVVGGPPANTPISSIVQILDYATTDKHKTILFRSGGSYNPTSAYVGRWASTSAVTSLVFVSNQGGNFSIGSTFNLYGIVS